MRRNVLGSFSNYGCSRLCNLVTRASFFRKMRNKEGCRFEEQTREREGGRDSGMKRGRERVREGEREDERKAGRL